MRPQTVLAKIRQIMFFLTIPNHCMLACNDHDIAFPVQGQLESLDRFVAFQSHLHLRERSAEMDHIIYVLFLADINSDEGAESAVVPNGRVRDWADHSSSSRAPLFGDSILEEKNIGTPIWIALVAHTVVPCDGDLCSEINQLADPLIQRRTESVRLLRARGILVLNLVRQRKVEQICPVLFKQLDTSIQHEQGQLARVLRWL